MIHKDRTKFQRWVLQNYQVVMEACKVTYPAVHQWHSGKTRPTIEHAMIIERISDRTIVIADVYTEINKRDL